MTKQEVFKILVLIESVYPSFVTKDNTVLEWLGVSPQMDYERVMGKILSHIRKSPYPPTIADIVEGNVEIDMKKERWFIKASSQIKNKNASWRPVPAWMFEYTLRSAAQI